MSETGPDSTDVSTKRLPSASKRSAGSPVASSEGFPSVGKRCAEQLNFMGSSTR